MSCRLKDGQVYIYRVHGSCLINSILNHSLKIEKQNHEIDQIALLNDVDCEHPSVSYTHTHTHTHTHTQTPARTHTHTHKSVRTFKHGQEPWTRDFRNFTCNHGHKHFFHMNMDFLCIMYMYVYEI